jgi:hypothetical protein
VRSSLAETAPAVTDAPIRVTEPALAVTSATRSAPAALSVTFRVALRVLVRVKSPVVLPTVRSRPAVTASSRTVGARRVASRAATTEKAPGVSRVTSTTASCPARTVTIVAPVTPPAPSPSRASKLVDSTCTTRPLPATSGLPE